MGITGNFLDVTYSNSADIPIILAQFASQCVTAALTSPSSCPFAAASMQKSDPAADIVARINAIASALSKRSYYIAEDNDSAGVNDSVGDNDLAGHTFSIFGLSDDLPSFLEDPTTWGDAIQYLYNAEQAIALDPSTELMPQGPPSPPEDAPMINTNLTLDSYETFGQPPFSYNVMSFAAVSCLDASLDNMATQSEFVDYISGQIAENVIIAYVGVTNAVCLGWPSLAAYNVETYRAPFPKSISNKILVIGETMSPWSSYDGTVATYQYIGSDNAVFVTYDGVGNGIYTDPNNCTYDAIRQFFLTGKQLVRIELTLLGTLPENGTKCTTDHSGPNNVFLQNPFIGHLLTRSNGNRHRLLIGLGLGLGFPLLVLSIIALGLWNLRKKNNKWGIPQLQRSARRDAMTRLERMKSEERSKR